MKKNPNDIRKLIAVAFLGGLVSMMIMGTINGRRLKVNQFHIVLLLLAGVLMLGLRIFCYIKLGRGELDLDTGTFASLSRVLAVLLFALYYAVFRKPYARFRETGQSPAPLFRPGVLWVITGAVMEFLILFFAYGLFNHGFGVAF